MKSITIDGVEKALEACAWCKAEGITWEMDLQPFTDNPAYTFKFFNSLDASIFALRWI